MESPTFRSRHRSHFLVRWDAVITCIVCLVVGVCIGMAVQFAIMSPLLTPR